MDSSLEPRHLVERVRSGQLRVRALNPELVWLAHVHEPWRPRHEA